MSEKGDANVTLIPEKIPFRFAGLAEFPKHLVLSALCAAFLTAGFFLPTTTLNLFNSGRLTLSFFQILTNGAMHISIHDTRYLLSFGGAMPFLILSILLPAVSLAMIVFFRQIASKLTARLAEGIVLLSLSGAFISLILAPSRLVPASLLAESGLTGADLFFAPNFLGNLLILIAILGIAASLYGTTGLTIKIRMLSYPYFLWLIIFTILPLFLIFIAAFFKKDAGGVYQFTTDGFTTLLVDRIVETKFYGVTLHLQEYFSVFLRSLDFAVWTTLGCLIIAYPLAYALASRTRRNHSSSSLLLMFFVLPMWINTMLRTYAWLAVFSQSGVLNNLLVGLHIISEPILFLKIEWVSDFIIKFVLVNDFLPFMLLPIYSVLVKLDENVKQAAHDLGANSRQTFLRVVFPLSMPGVISGIQMVFMPSLTFFMIPEIISEGSVTTIGATVQTLILNQNTMYQQAGNVLSLLLLVFVLITMGILRNSDKDSGGGGMVL